MRTVPTEPGFYWARWNEDEEPLGWCIVQLKDYFEGMIVLVTGSEIDERPESFLWGPKLEPPQ